MALSTQTALGSHLSIFSKGLLLIAAPVVFQLALLYVVRDMQATTRHAGEWARHSREVLASADDLSRLIIQLVASERGAVLTGNPDFEVESRPAPGEITQRLDDLQRLLAENPAQAARVGEIRTATRSLQEWITSEQDLLAQGRAVEAAERVRSGESTRRVRHVRDLMVAFLAEETRIGDEREAAVVLAERREREVTVIGAIVTLLLALALVYLFTRSIAGRLAVVAENAGRLAAGAPLQSPVAGTDEIAQLDRVLHATAAQLAETKAAEHQAREENELFIYSVSHDLRSPLVNLQGFSKELTRAGAELRRLLQADGIPPDVRTSVTPLIEQDIPESVHFIKTAVTRASLIIDALLRLSRAGRVEYRWQAVPVQTVVGNVLDAMRAAINERQAEVIVQPLADAWGDRVAVEQVFANLIGNAVNYLDPHRRGRIEIGMVEPGTYFVKDNGLGIPASGLPKVFVAFQRLHGRVAHGEGIGLALVRRIVERHHGEIWVESTEGVGSTFFVRLPASDPGRPSAQEA